MISNSPQAQLRIRYALVAFLAMVLLGLILALTSKAQDVSGIKPRQAAKEALSKPPIVKEFPADLAALFQQAQDDKEKADLRAQVIMYQAGYAIGLTKADADVATIQKVSVAPGRSPQWSFILPAKEVAQATPTPGKN